MNFLKASFFSGISTLLQMLASLVLYKLVAIKLGAEGIGQLGQFVTLLSIVLIISNAGINNGIIKLVAQNKFDLIELRKVLQTAFVIIFISVFFCIFTFFFTMNYIFTTVFYLEKLDNNFFILFLLSIFFISMSQFLLSIINGFKHTKIYAASISIGSILSIIFSFFLIQKFGLYGAFYTLLLNYCIQSIFLFYIVRYKLCIDVFFKFNLNIEIFKKYLNYSIMFIFSAVAIPLAQIIIRHFIGDNYSLKEMGYWESLFRMSSIYITFISVFFSIFYLPHLAERNDREIVNNGIKILKILTVLLLIMFFIVFLLKDFIITLLFSEDFLIISNYIFIQQVGDFFRILSLSIGYIIIVKMWTKIYLVFELIHFLLLIILSYLFLKITGDFKGASIAYTITYFLLFIINLSIFLKFKKGIK